MDFTRTEAQDDLGQLTRSITEKLVTSDRLRALDGAEDRFDDVTWRSLAESRCAVGGTSRDGRR